MKNTKKCNTITNKYCIKIRKTCFIEQEKIVWARNEKEALDKIKNCDCETISKSMIIPETSDETIYLENMTVKEYNKSLETFNKNKDKITEERNKIESLGNTFEQHIEDKREEVNQRILERIMKN